MLVDVSDAAAKPGLESTSWELRRVRDGLGRGEERVARGVQVCQERWVPDVPTVPAVSCILISHNVLIEWIQKVNPPPKTVNFIS